METQTLTSRHVAGGPRAEILNTIRNFARAYRPIAGTPYPGIVLN